MFFFSAKIRTNILTARDHSQVMRKMVRAMMQFWRDVLLVKHFSNVPETRKGGAYGFQPRERWYQISKARKFGFIRPNWKSGETRRRTLRATITATKNRGRIKARLRFQDAERVREIEALSDAESRNLLARARRLYLRLASGRSRRKRRARSI